MNTTNTNEPIERKEKQKGTLFVADLEMRDYFAAKALWGVLNENHMTQKQMAEWSYEMADEMLKAREA